MTFLPIVERELRVTARQRSTRRTRLVVASAVIGIWLFLSLVSGLSTPPQRAQAIFGVVSVASLGFAMLAGVFLTADSLSEERREGTLGLLFLTDLKGHDVVLGKLVSTSVRAFYNLLGIVPMLALPFLMGGMTAGEFWRVALVLLATLFLSLSSGMLISAISRDTRAAMMGTLFVMIVLAGVLPALWWLQVIVQRTPMLDFLLWPGPGYAYRRALAAYYSAYTGPQEFWASIVTIVGLGLLCLVAASVLLPRLWQEAGKASSSQDVTRSGYRLRFGSAKFRAARRPLLEARPFYWLVTRDRLPKLWSLGCFAILIPIWLGFFAGTWSPLRTRSSQIYFSVALFMSYGLHQIFKSFVAAEASRRLSEDRHSGALELLLVTPLPPSEIIAAQQKAVWNCFNLPRLVLVLVNLLMLYWLVAVNPFGMNGESFRMFFCVFAGGIAMLYLDSFALARVGMWSALRTKRHTRAILATLGRVMLPVWLSVLFCWFTAIARLSFGSSSPEIYLALWFAVAVVVDIVVSVNAHFRLRNDFREAVAGVRAEAKLPEPDTSGTPWKFAGV